MQALSKLPGWIRIALVFAVLTIVAGIALALLAPTISATVEHGQLALDPNSTEARFQTLVWYAALSAVGGLIGGVAAWRVEPHRRGVTTELLATGYSLLAAMGIFYISWMTASFLHPIPHAHSLKVGDVVQWVPISFSYAALPLMPFCTAVVYWALLVTNPEPPDTHPTE